MSEDKDLENISEEFLQALAEQIKEDLLKDYENYSKDLYISHNNSDKSKKSFTEVQKFVNDTYAQIYLYEKGLQIISSDDLKTKLIKLLQKTLCSDILTELFSYFTEENVSANLSSDARIKLISSLEPDIKESLIKINVSLTSNDVKDFLLTLEQFSFKLDILLKKVDKKKEKTLLSEHRQSLILELSQCEDPILGLHISTMIIFQVLYDNILHYTGKFVPQILLLLGKELDHDLYSVFKESHDLVLRFVSTKDQTLKDELFSKMSDIFKSYRQRVIEYKKLKNN